jgi:hypothetical protein
MKFRNRSKVDFLVIRYAQGAPTPACPAYAEAASRRQAKRPHFGVQALNLTWYRAGTKDENDCQERITRMVTNGPLFA